MSDIDDGSDKPLGYLSPDGELEVRESTAHGQTFVGYHETELGQHMRWMRQAPDLFEKYRAALDTIRELRERYGEAQDATD